MSRLHLRPLSFYLKLIAATLVATVLGLIFLASFLMAAILTIPLTSQVCCETPARFGADYEPVSFTTTDGLTLRGWYVPPRNSAPAAGRNAVIILIHSYYADRRQTLPVAEMLFKHGYGLLMYDQRASGESDGGTRSLGRLDIPDLAQAANYLAARHENLKIGAYGCSMGGAIALAGAVGVPQVRAIAVDAPSPLSWPEYHPAFSLRDPFSLPITALYFGMVGLRSWALPPTSSLDAAHNYGPRPILLISTGQGGEFARVSAYFEAAPGPKTHWNLPDSSHCAAPSTHPQEYERHLVEFFATALLDQP
jgi:pimeloyl-ACP methyl ester carboxylesterase